MAYNVYHNFLIQASAEKVFNAVSQPEHLDNWWTYKSSGEPKIDSEYNLNFTEAYDWYCKVTKITPNQSIYFKMTKSDTDWNPTTFGFDLEEKNGGTYVRFSHIDWPEDNDHYKHSSFCWAMLLNGLKKYLEKGEVIPFENRS